MTPGFFSEAQCPLWLHSNSPLDLLLKTHTNAHTHFMNLSPMVTPDFRNSYRFMTKAVLSENQNWQAHLDCVLIQLYSSVCWRKKYVNKPQSCFRFSFTLRNWMQFISNYTSGHGINMNWRSTLFESELDKTKLQKQEIVELVSCVDLLLSCWMNVWGAWGHLAPATWEKLLSSSTLLDLLPPILPSPHLFIFNYGLEYESLIGW